MKKNIIIFIILGVVLCGLGVIQYYRASEGIVTSMEKQLIQSRTQKYIDKLTETPIVNSSFSDGDPRRAEFVVKASNDFAEKEGKRMQKMNKLIGVALIVLGAGMVVATFLTGMAKKRF